MSGRIAAVTRVCPYCDERTDTPRCRPCDAPTIQGEIADRIDAALGKIRAAAGGER